jgi:molybdate transport system substrate-binding protein
MPDADREFSRSYERMDLRGFPAAKLCLVISLTAALGALTGCGSSGSQRPPLLVSAAASLKSAFTQYGNSFRDAKTSFSFAGSDQLAAQIQQGAKPDVFASANTKLPDQLFGKGLCEKPVVFTANRLVIGVPSQSQRVRSAADLTRPGTTIAIGSPTVPVGAYTRQALARLPAAEANQIMANVKSTDPDVNAIVGKLTQGAVDAGFVYTTDVAATKGRVSSVALPAESRPQVAYGACVVKGSPHPNQAHQFVQGLLSGPGQQDLRAAGFEPAPG